MIKEQQLIKFTFGQGILIADVQAVNWDELDTMEFYDLTYYMISTKSLKMTFNMYDTY